jgi:chromosome partitioning protein
MGNVLCIASQKGGVGKTTTAVNLAIAFAIAEKQTLLIDCDPQGSATAGMGIPKQGLNASLYQIMTGEAVVEATLVPSEIPYLATVPAKADLFRVEFELNSARGKEHFLRKSLNGIRDKYDYILLDSPPSIGLMTINAMTASDILLVPLQCEYFALEGLGQFLRIVQNLKNGFNSGLRITGILLTMVESNEPNCRQIVREARRSFGNLVFNTVIPRSTQLKESPSKGKPLLLQDLSSDARFYLKVAEEIMGSPGSSFL